MARRSKTATSPLSSGLEGPQRLQRVLAAAGFGSRRQCEELIEAGRVHVDGKLVEKLGAVVDPDEAKILVDGQQLKRQKLVYFAVNKPVGVVTTNADPQGRPRVIDLVPPNERVFPVGRLDLSSEGLILLTNDGELAQHLAHPKYGIQKVYRVTVAGKVDSQALRKMREGIYIAEGHVSVDGAKVLKAKARSTEMEISLREGKNREIRRILARLGHKVQTLRRIAIGTLRLGDIPPGSYRPLTREEVRKLQVCAVTPPPKKEASDDGATDEKSPMKSGMRKTGRPKTPGLRPPQPSSSTRPALTSRSKSSSTSRSKDRSPSAERETSAEPRATPRKKSPVATVRKPKSGEFVIRVDRENAAGAVIGGDPRPKSKPKPEPKPERKPTKPAAGAASKKSSPATSRTGKKSVSSSRPSSSRPSSSRPSSSRPSSSRPSSSRPRVQKKRKR